MRRQSSKPLQTVRKLHGRSITRLGTRKSYQKAQSVAVITTKTSSIPRPKQSNGGGGAVAVRRLEEGSSFSGIHLETRWNHRKVMRKLEGRWCARQGSTELLPKQNTLLEVKLAQESSGLQTGLSVDVWEESQRLEGKLGRGEEPKRGKGTLNKVGAKQSKAALFCVCLRDEDEMGTLRLCQATSGRWNREAETSTMEARRLRKKKKLAREGNVTRGGREETIRLRSKGRRYSNVLGRGRGMRGVAREKLGLVCSSSEENLSFPREKNISYSEL